MQSSESMPGASGARHRLRAKSLGSDGDAPASAGVSHGNAAVGISQALDRDGYVVIDAVLKPTELDTIRAAVGPLIARTPLGRNAFEGRRTRRVYSLLAKTRATDWLASGEFLHAVARELLGHHQLSAHVAVQVGVESVAQELHTDDQVYPVARPHAELVVSALWAIDDLNPAGGTTLLIPGSHRWEDRAPTAAELASAIEVPVRAGGLLLYRGSLWHGVGQNTSRDAAIFVYSEYIASWLRPLESHLLSIPRSTVRQLPARLQELIGYNIRPPYTGSVNGRHPLRALRRFWS